MDENISFSYDPELDELFSQPVEIEYVYEE